MNIVESGTRKERLVSAKEKNYNLTISRLKVADTQHELQLEQLQEALDLMYARIRQLQVQVESIESQRSTDRDTTLGSLSRLEKEIDKIESKIEKTQDKEEREDLIDHAKKEAVGAFINWATVATLSGIGALAIGITGLSIANQEQFNSSIDRQLEMEIFKPRK